MVDRARKPARWIALLRGINVGGKNKLPMADLTAICTGVGCTGVKTFIQSGNVVFDHAGSPTTIARDLASAIADRSGLHVPVIVVTQKQLAAVIADNPFLANGTDPDTLHVAFLADPPSKAAVARLDPKRSPGDAFAVGKQVMWLHLPNGVARTKLTNAWLDATLATTSTIRNWRTVLQLAEMAGC
ncbi:MAG: DUF1697 domain-containing protein [Planctomycetes bacterium]|nr:DUF1697 domain-containing protein [Planctomycetota bacterium]